MKYVLMILTAAVLTLSCSEDSADTTIDDQMEQEEKEEEKEENGTELPEGFLVIETDTFYVSGTSQLPDPNFSRFQINFSSKEQLTETGNDGNTQNTFGLVITTLSPITESGTLSFTDTRFLSVEGTVNFYMSFFFNTGHPWAGNNYLSPEDGEFIFTVTDGSFEAEINQLMMKNEASVTETFLLSGKISY